MASTFSTYHLGAVASLKLLAIENYGSVAYCRLVVTILDKTPESLVLTQDSLVLSCIRVD